MVKMPVIAAGILNEPPMSVPTPRGLPQAAINADSPPEEPPEVSCRLRGLVVLFVGMSALSRTAGHTNVPNPHLP
jgi:hypothetical protein